MTENRFRSHFSSFQINTQLNFFTKWLPAAILDDRKSLSNAFLHISDQYATFFDLGHFGWPKITFNRISRHFRSIHNFLFWIIFSKWPPAAIWEVRFAPKTIGFFHYVLSVAMPNMKLIGEFVTRFRDATSFWAFLYKMAARGHFVFPIEDKNHKVLVIWDLNGYGENEFNRCFCDKVMACTSVGVRRRRRRRRRNQKHNITEIYKFRGYNNHCIIHKMSVREIGVTVLLIFIVYCGRYNARSHKMALIKKKDFFE